jgi:hypothetical protein
MALEVPAAGGRRLKASGLFVVEHAGEGDRESRRSAPVIVRGLQLYPRLGVALPRASAEAEFFLRAWPAAGRESVDADFELLRGSEVVVAHRIAPLVVDESGEINMLTRVSVSELPPGPYNFMVTLWDGHDMASRTVDLTIAADPARNP